jgi:D-alanyl-D-alanine carboxypeptidase
MRKPLIFPLILLLVGVCLVTASLSVYIWPSQTKGNENIISPLVKEANGEDIIGTTIYDQIKNRKTTDNYPPNNYFPLKLEPKYFPNLDLSAKAYAVMDRDSRELLLAKNLTSEKQIASVTKIMTAIVALEKDNPDREIIVPEEAAKIGEAVMGISQGENYTLRELLYGLLMVSGNDAAETIAFKLGRGRIWFIDQMNRKAVGLGLFDTSYVNPTGLDEETREISSYSTALDLLGLANYALNNRLFAEIVATKYHVLPYKAGYHKAISLSNILEFDRSYPGIKGVKTGNTDFAHQTLVSYAENDGRKILVVLLDSEATRDDAVKIYKYIYENNR